MTDVSKLKFPAPLVGAIVVSLATSVGGYSVALYRISEHAERLASVEIERKNDRELLVRIDERTAEMKRIMERGNAEIRRLTLSADNKIPGS
jgi:pyrimidine deaminase RibD-like protein